MAAPDNTPIFAGGELILSPSDFTTADDYGGTRLGITTGLEFVYRPVYAPILAAEYGNAETDGIFRHFECLLRFRIANWDANAVGTYFPGTSSGTKGVIAPISEAALASGALMSSNAVDIAHVARHSTAAAEDPSLRVYRAYPADELSTVVLRDSAPAEILCAFRCVMNSSEEIAKWARAADQ